VRGKTPTLLDPLERANLRHWIQGPNRVGVSPPHLKAETDPVSETLCLRDFRIPDNGQSPKTSNSEFFVLFIETIAVNSDNCTNIINKFCGENVSSKE
jgi:hypothetical protein